MLHYNPFPSRIIYAIPIPSWILYITPIPSRISYAIHIPIPILTFSNEAFGLNRSINFPVRRH